MPARVARNQNGLTPIAPAHGVSVAPASATEGGKDSALAFRAGPVELEFQVAFEATAAADAGVRVWVISAGAKGEASHSASHRLKVTLTPVGRQGQDALIGSVGSR